MQQAAENPQTESQIILAFPPAPPSLLVNWQPWWPHFLNNIADLFRAAPPPIRAQCAPDKFWPDVFVNRPLPWKNFLQSGFFHGAVILFVLTTGRLWLFPPTAVIEDPYQNTTLTYYRVDELLPAVKSAPAPAPREKAPQKGQPEFARQEIISVPAAADNSTQTIVNPPHPEILRREVALPNIVVSTPAPAPPTLALSKSQITFPALDVAPVQPAPDVQASTKSNIRNVPAPTVAQPAVSADAMKRKLDEIKIEQSQLDAKVEAPKIELPVQTAAAPPPKEENTPPPPPAPAVTAESLRGGQRPAGQLLALNLHPAPPAAEIKVPDANRAGVFAATPAGKQGAPGTPDVAGGKSPEGSESAGTGKAPGAGGNSDSPLGISIGGPRMNPSTAAVVSGPTALPPPSRQASDDKKRLMAAAAPPSFADIARKGVPPYSPPSTERKPEDAVFAGKKYYSMQLNMPNLTSAGGSWIIRFAELKQDVVAGELSTPVATSKVDPAYPADLIHDHVEGTVVLYAIIHADGSVGDVRVLQGFHEKLDENAKIALGRWHFRPAMKNGLPVELEAVVQIPFKTRKSGF
jgi:TonB family protein